MIISQNELRTLFVVVNQQKLDSYSLTGKVVPCIFQNHQIIQECKQIHLFNINVSIGHLLYTRHSSPISVRFHHYSFITENGYFFDSTIV